MNPAEREQVRLGLLRYLDKAAPRHLTLDLLAAYLDADGSAASAADVAAEAQYLVDKGLAVWHPEGLSPERKRLRILAAGRDYLAMAR